jgi:hypothetical protein
MNGVYKAIAGMVTQAPGVILSILLRSVIIVIHPIGNNVMISQDILPHGSGPAFMVQIVMQFNGAPPEVHGMTFMVDRFTEHGVL